MKIDEKIDRYLINETSNLRKYQGKDVIITMKSGAKYGGKLHNSSDDTIVLSNYYVISKEGSVTKSGASEKRTFKTKNIKNVENK